jgi:hypothetical protein
MMARKPTLSLFGSKQNRPVQEEEAPARRSVFVESLLCIAIRRRMLVKWRRKDDVADALFAPIVVYLSSEHKLCVRGVQIVGLETLADNVEVHTFEIGEIKSISLTEQPFVIDPAIDRYDDMFKNGIICSAD